VKNIIHFISNSKNKKKVEFYRLIFQVIGFAIFVYYGSQSTMYVVILSIPLALLLGPVYCGWMCPRGLFQDMFAWLGRKIFGKRYNCLMPASFHPRLMSFRYILLLMVIISFTLSETYLISESAQILFLEALVAIMVLSVFMSLFIERAACKYFCKEGAVGGVCNLIKSRYVKRNSSLCNSCGLCDRVCPMSINISKKDLVDNHLCISCFKCVQQCPTDALYIKR
jgi:ferredoxin-type protein NapH